ncbi:MAG: hypothetical protein KDD99_05175 [Bacteroidetes bacterium]|nr:hypothetical protein [Bacteroidota bacterium]
MANASQHKATPNPAIIVEVKKILASFFDLSVYNLPFYRFLQFVDGSTTIRELNILALTQQGEYIDMQLEEIITFNQLNELIHKPQNVTFTDISMSLDDDQSIDTNLEDEIFCTLSDSVDMNTLVTRILNEDQRNNFMVFPEESDAFCLVKKGGQIMQYRSFRNYLATAEN